MNYLFHTKTLLVTYRPKYEKEVERKLITAQNTSDKWAQNSFMAISFFSFS